MRAVGQITLTRMNDVSPSDTPPENPDIGTLWINTGEVPPETMVWDGLRWVTQNDLDTLRTTVSTHSARFAEFQNSVDGLTSYVSNLTESVETVTGDLEGERERITELNEEMSRMRHSVDGLTLTVSERFAGGINLILNSAGLNGITEEWETVGSVRTDNSTEVRANTVSDSCFILESYSSLRQVIANVPPGSYVLSVCARKTSASHAAYLCLQYNGGKTAYPFNTAEAFGWTRFTVSVDDVRDGTIVLYAYNRDGELYLSDMILMEGSAPAKWTPAPNEIYTTEVKIDRRGIEVSNASSPQRTVINNTEFSGYYNEERIFTLNKDETLTKKTTVDGELTVGKTKFVPLSPSSDGLNIVILD